MILCVNPNAAIDKTVVVSPFRLGQIHRPIEVKALPGGKGCNVARALKRLGDEPVVTGWVGGYAGQFIEDGLHREGIATDFVHTDFESRTCLSILAPTSHTITEIYENGEPVPPDQIDALREHFRAIIGRYAAVTFSGSLPTGAPPGFYRDLIAIAKEAGVLTLLDSSRDPLRQGAEAGPDLIKPNRDEVAALIGSAPQTFEQVTAAARTLARQYDTRAVISMGAEGAVASDGKMTLYARSPRVDAQSAVGSGDCMLAGLAWGLTRGLPLEESLRLGVAAGTANTLHIGAGQFTLESFEQVRSQVDIVVVEGE